MAWVAAVMLVAGCYTACAWLWAAPYRTPAPPPVATLAATNSPAVARSAEPPSSSARPHLTLPQPPIRLSEARTPPLTNTRNFLIVGLDRRADGTGPALADTLLVVVLDEHSKHVGLVSIPRDLYVAIPDSDSDRINTVYQLAKRSKREPLALLRRVVQDTLQLPLEHVLALDLGVFERAVDAVGGVDVDVPCPIADNFLDSRAQGGRRMLDVDEGHRHLDGVTAAMYARSRHGRSDFHRARRQQAILLGVQRALSGVGMLKLPDLLDAFESSVETDMRRIELLALARRALSLDPGHLHGVVIGREQVTGFRTPDGKSVLLPNYQAIDLALAKLLSAPSPGVRPVHAVCAPKGAALAGSGAT